MSKFFNDFRGNRNLQKNEKKRKRGKKRSTNKATDKKRKTNATSFLHASAILFSSVLVHLCVLNSTVNEWSDSVVVCATSCEVTQTGKFCKHTRMLCKHFFAWVRAKSRGFAPVSCSGLCVRAALYHRGHAAAIFPSFGKKPLEMAFSNGQRDGPHSGTTRWM